MQRLSRKSEFSAKHKGHIRAYMAEHFHILDKENGWICNLISELIAVTKRLTIIAWGYADSLALLIPWKKQQLTTADAN